mgnify:CR=1 FL=1
MIMAVINATGVEPVSSAGKPESAMYDEARILAAHDDGEPVDKEQCLAIGDRLDTDIEAGNRGGYDSLAVLTGVTNPRELMFAPAYLRPTYIAKDLRGLNEPAPEVVHDEAHGCAAMRRPAVDRRPPVCHRHHQRRRVACRMLRHVGRGRQRARCE